MAAPPRAPTSLVPNIIEWLTARLTRGPTTASRRYHAGCNHCHGPDGVGSMFGPPLVDRLPAIDVFRHIVRDGVRKGNSVMQGFSGDENVAPYIDDIYAYLQARADGMLGRGRPARLGQ